MMKFAESIILKSIKKLPKIEKFSKNNQFTIYKQKKICYNVISFG